jgi:hypothetical protein
MKTPEFENVLISEKRKRGDFKMIYFQKTKKIYFQAEMKTILFRRLYIKRKKENDLISLLSRLQVVGGLFIFTRGHPTSRLYLPIIIIPQRSDDVKPISTNRRTN